MALQEIIALAIGGGLGIGVVTIFAMSGVMRDRQLLYQNNQLRTSIVFDFIIPSIFLILVALGIHDWTLFGPSYIRWLVPGFFAYPFSLIIFGTFGALFVFMFRL